jgi:energy-coupling factor transporter ATP-binding protein EcfA2
MAISFSASEKGLEIVDLARKKKGWAATADAWIQAAGTTAATLKRFRRGLPIQKDVFISICKAVGLDNWEEIVDDSAIQQTDQSDSEQEIDAAGLFIKTLWEGAGEVLGGIGQSLDEKTKQLIFQASQQYVQNYTNRHGILKVLGMRQPVTLESVYTNVQILDEWDIGGFESIETLGEIYSERLRRRWQFKNVGKQKGITVVNKKQYLMVLGPPGAGKSTFLRHIGVEALKGKQGEVEHACIPVFIELKRLCSSEIDIEKFIIEEFRIGGLPLAEEFTAHALQQGKLLILLDGLDEVPTTYRMNQVIEQIQDFVAQYDKNRFIASCRTAAYRHNLLYFTDVALAEFDDSQIEQFIHNWFQSDVDKEAETAHKCWKLLQKPENAAIKELAYTPLLLTLICLVYDRSQSLPNNRSILYRKALHVLLEEWAAEKRLQQDEIYPGFHTELEEIFLAQIAHTGFEEDRIFFSGREIVEQIKTFFTSNLNAPKHLDGKAVLNAIVVQQGILVERAEDVYSFSHIALQEYLTAQYIDDHREIEHLVVQHFTDKYWQEVFLLVAGLMRGGVDELLLLMEKEAQKYMETPKLHALLGWAEQATARSQSNLKPTAKRAIALALALGSAYNFAFSIDSVDALSIALIIDSVDDVAVVIDNAKVLSIDDSIALANELKRFKIFNEPSLTLLMARLEALKAKFPGIYQPLEVPEALFEGILKTCFEAFNVSPELVNLSEEEAKAIGSYLYANWLIVQCKQAAVRVSPKTWEGIEERMLQVPGD